MVGEKPIIKHGTTIPPQINAARKGDICIQIDQVLWKIPFRSPTALILLQWWGERTRSVEFQVATSMDTEKSMIALFPVVSPLHHLISYLEDMGDGLELAVMDDVKKTSLGVCQLNLSALREDNPIQGCFEVLCVCILQCTLSYPLLNSSVPPSL